MMDSIVLPNQWVALKLPSESIRVLQVTPDTTVSLGKYGSFPSNLILHRPYHLTYEVQDKRYDENFSRLRIVPAAELHADTLADTRSSPDEPDAAAQDPTTVISAGKDGVEFSVIDSESGKVIARSNHEVIDESARQTLTMDEIETLKRDGGAAGKDLITKLMLSHTALDQKTTFSLAKYKLLKTKKYIRRFTVLPLDATMLAQYFLEEKDAIKILELREETLALMNSWANVHFGGEDVFDKTVRSVEEIKNGIAMDHQPSRKWLVIDDTGGLLVAAMAERMGILHQSEADSDISNVERPGESQLPESTGDSGCGKFEDGTIVRTPDRPGTKTTGVSDGKPRRPRGPRKDDFQNVYSFTNTITVLHANAQPNLAMLRYFNFDITNPDPIPPLHPLVTHLLTISWLQLLEPELDTTYAANPSNLSQEELSTWKANRRGAYHRKRRRWCKIRHIVDTTRAGGFSGLAVASTMDPISILRHALPLLSGGAPVVIYSQSIEPLLQLADCFSIARRASWASDPPPRTEGMTMEELERWPGTDGFPINPTLLLGAIVQTTRARPWQVLPGRTHPLMTGRGGAEGYVFTAWRAIPAEGKVEARGKFKKRKTEA